MAGNMPFHQVGQIDKALSKRSNNLIRSFLGRREIQHDRVDLSDLLLLLLLQLLQLLLRFDYILDRFLDYLDIGSKPRLLIQDELHSSLYVHWSSR